MAERRMFTKKITDGDEFTSMPPTTQCLYFHLCMGADDDGFSNNIRIAMFNAHASTDDFNTLVSKRFIIPFESGVIVIKHWKMHNYIRNDRYSETKYVEERSKLILKDNGVYSLCEGGIPSVDQRETQVRLDKDSIGKSKDSIGKGVKPTPKRNNIDNLIHLIETDKEKYKEIADNPNLMKIVAEWLDYKQQKGKQHLIYAEASLKKLLEKFIDAYVMYGNEPVYRAVSESIGAGYQGIVWEKMNPPKSNRNINNQIDAIMNIQ